MNWKFSHEPVAWLGAFAAVLVLVKSIVNHEPLTETILEPVLVAISAVVVRTKVTPVAKDK